MLLNQGVVHECVIHFAQHVDDSAECELSLCAQLMAGILGNKRLNQVARLCNPIQTQHCLCFAKQGVCAKFRVRIKKDFIKILDRGCILLLDQIRQSEEVVNHHRAFRIPILLPIDLKVLNQLWILKLRQPSHCMFKE